MKTILAMTAAVLTVGAGAVARAAEAPLYQPAPAWVKAVAIPSIKPDQEEGAAQVLLQNTQTRFTAEGDDYFQELAVKIRTATGLTEWGSVIMSWRPDTDTLVIHRLNIIRGAQVIDLLGGGKNVTVLRREKNLEMSMLDGTLTATVQPEGLQVGDVIDMAYTRQTHDPVMKGHSEDWTSLARPGTVGNAYVRAIWPKTKPIRLRTTEGMAKPVITDTADGREMVIDMHNVEAPTPPRGAPLRYAYVGQMQASEFASWAEVSTLSWPLYLKASTLTAGSPLRAEAAKIKASSADPKVRAMAALKLVEDKVRYLYLGLNNGGYVPADADVTWGRRFGDCKAKTVLLLALLRELDIQAQPALVNTATGDGLDERLPSMDAFDHVAVKAVIGGKTYWMDGTRVGDTVLDDLPMQNFHWMLPVQTAGGALEAMLPTIYADALFESKLNLDASAGIDSPAKAHVEHTLRGDAGLAMELAMDSVTRTDMDRAMRAYWRKVMPWVEAKQVTFARAAAHQVTLSMDGDASMTWDKDTAGRDFFVDDSAIGYQANFEREPGPNRDAPFAIPYPGSAKRTVSITLPGQGAGFILLNAAPVDKTAAGVAYKRTARIERGVAIIETTQSSVGPEISAADATASIQTLRDWANHPIGLRAPTRRADNDQTNAWRGQAAPKIAAKDWMGAIGIYNTALLKQPNSIDLLLARAYARHMHGDYNLAIADYTAALQAGDRPETLLNRGLAYAAIKDWPHAIEDYSKSIVLRPDERAFLNRGRAYALTLDWSRSADDYDRAIGFFIVPSIGPSAELLLAAGYSHQMKGDATGALQDYEKAIRLKPDLRQVFMNRGLLYLGRKENGPAIKEFTRAIELDGKEFNGWRNRGLAHMAQEELQAAIEDFNQAIKLKPDYADTFNDRGYARQRLKMFDVALADYNVALGLKPDLLKALGNRASVYMLMKRWDDAASDFGRMIQQRPDDPSPYLYRANMYLLNKDQIRAAADVERALGVKADFPAALLMRAAIRMDKGDAKAGLADLDRVTGNAPGDANVLNLACWERAKRGLDLDVALARCDAAIQASPKAAYLDSRALVHYRRGEYAKALADLDAALTINPNLGASLYVRGLTKQHLGQAAGAGQDIAAAKVLTPDVAETYAKMGVGTERVEVTQAAAPARP